MLTELRQAARALARNPVFATVAVLSLAIGIGANTAAFSLVNGLLLRPLGVRDGGRLVDVYEHNPVALCPGCGVGTSWPAYRELADVRTLSGIAAYRTDPLTIRLPAGAAQVRGAHVTASLFPLLGVTPVRGRGFLPEEDRAGGAPVVLIGERLWRSALGGRDDVIGRPLRVNGVTRTIVGVMPSGLPVPESSEAWLPLAPLASADTRADRRITVIARLRPGAALAETRAELAARGASLARAAPTTNAGWMLHADPLRGVLAADYAPSFFVILGLVTLVLLVACANLANLLMARASARRQELAVRAALGASRGALARHVLVESLLVSVLAGLLGALWAAWLLAAFRSVVGDALPSWLKLEPDARVILFGALLSLGTGILFGALPAWRVARTDQLALLHAGTRGAIAAPARARMRSVFVGVQVAVAAVLLTTTLLFTREALRVARFDHGIDPAGFHEGRIIAPGERYARPGEVALLAETLTGRLAASVGTHDVALSTMYVPNWPGTPPTTLRAQGRDPAEVAGAIHRVLNVTPAYFATHGQALVSGRDFRASDHAGAEPVAIVGAALAHALWPEQDPLGRQLHLGGPEDDWVTVVGVAPSRLGSPFARDTARLLYLPIAQHAPAQPQPEVLTLHLRLAATAAPAEARVRGALRDVDPDLVLEALRSARELRAAALGPVRITTLAVLALALFALFLAALGVYGVIAFSVAQRSTEIGVRMALGSSARGIAAMVLRQALVLTGLGLVAGTAAALAVERIVRSQLVGAAPLGVPAHVAAWLALLGIALLASWVPARRAARVDPMTALRAE